MLVLILAIWLVQRYYLRTSRQVRLLEIEAKAPLYTHFTDTIRGVASIRAYGVQRAFGARLAEMLDESQRPFYMLFLIQQWLTLVLDLVVGASAVVLVGLALGLAGSGGGGISAGSLGAALVLVIQFNTLLIGVSAAHGDLQGGPFLSRLSLFLVLLAMVVADDSISFLFADNPSMGQARDFDRSRSPGPGVCADHAL